MELLARSVTAASSAAKVSLKQELKILQKSVGILPALMTTGILPVKKGIPDE
jgi:hypothetical protein